MNLYVDNIVHSIVRSGLVENVIRGDRFINVVEVYHNRYMPDENINSFSIGPDSTSILLKAGAKRLAVTCVNGRRVRFGIYPDDIALVLEPLNNTSIQNQLPGIVIHLCEKNNSCFVTVDCGIELIAEVTNVAVKIMGLKPGKKIYCLIKAKAIEVIHIYDD